ncbi:MAG: MurR/RpiR family transcriptional regulator [Clostridium sp.]
MKENILNYLQENVLKVSKSQRLVADYILKNPIESTYSTIEAMAKKVGVSTTTIVRLTINLGFSGYAEFQKELRELLKKQSDPTVKLEMNLESGLIKDNLVQEIINQQTGNLKATFETLVDETILKAESLITNSRKIYVIGGRSCYGVAHYLYYNLNRVYGKCELLSDEGTTLPEKIVKMREGDVIISLTLPRYIKNVIDVTEIAKGRGATVIGITDGYMSPLANHADILFTLSCKSLGFHNMATSLMLIADILISVCTMNNVDNVKTNLADIKRISDTLNIHINQ